MFINSLSGSAFISTVSVSGEAFNIYQMYVHPTFYIEHCCVQKNMAVSVKDIKNNNKNIKEKIERLSFVNGYTFWGSLFSKDKYKNFPVSLAMASHELNKKKTFVWVI